MIKCHHIKGVFMSSPPSSKEILYYPVAFKLLNPENIKAIPQRIDGGMYNLRAPYQISINVGSIKSISMQLAIKLPQCFELHTSQEGITIPMIPHAHIESLYDVLIGKGIEVLAPKTLSPSYSLTELKITVKNIGKEIANIEPGDPIACLYFTATPPIVFGENNNI